jgi:hypothetical protein
MMLGFHLQASRFEARRNLLNRPLSKFDYWQIYLNMGEKVFQDCLVKVLCKTNHKANRLVGRIIPISPGRMRNDFYPKKKAEYMTMAQLRETGMQESTMERDSNFGSRQVRSGARRSEIIASPSAVPPTIPIAVEVDLIKVRMTWRFT